MISKCEEGKRKGKGRVMGINLGKRKVGSGESRVTSVRDGVRVDG